MQFYPSPPQYENGWNEVLPCILYFCGAKLAVFKEFVKTNIIAVSFFRKECMPHTGINHSFTLEAIIAVSEAAVFLRDMLDSAVAPLGITSAQYTILRILKRAAPDGCNRAEILRQVLGKKADLTRQLDGLERLGFIARTRPASDRRVVIATITPQGVEALGHVDPLFREMLARLSKTLSPEQWITIAKLCRVISSAEPA